MTARTCSRCNAPDGPGHRIPPDRTMCHACRGLRAKAPLPAPRPPGAILDDHRARLDRSRILGERDAMAGEVRKLQAEISAIREMRGTHLPETPIVAPPPKSSKSEVVPLVVLSDWHVEEKVDAAKMHGLNEYTIPIAIERSRQCFVSASKLIAAAEAASKVERVVVALLGDFFSGSIHDELMEVNQLGPAPAAAMAKRLLQDGVEFLLKQHPKLRFDVPCVGGNHGRMTHKTRISTNAENSLESFMYDFLASEFSDEKRVKFHIAPGDEIYLDVFETFRLRCIHGDQIGYQGGVGGVTIPLNKWTMRQNEAIHADLTVLGHFHQARADRSWVCNGSLIGASPYSKRFGFAPEPPRQQFALIHATRGRTMVADIWCTP